MVRRSVSILAISVAFSIAAGMPTASAIQQTSDSGPSTPSGGVVTSSPLPLSAVMPNSVLLNCNSYEKYPSSGKYTYLPDNLNGAPLYANCTLGLGNTNPGVGVLQRALDTCYGYNLAQDSVYGAATQSAVRSVQSRLGVTQDGVYGPATGKRMSWPTFSLSGNVFLGCTTFPGAFS